MAIAGIGPTHAVATQLGSASYRPLSAHRCLPDLPRVGRPTMPNSRRSRTHGGSRKPRGSVSYTGRLACARMGWERRVGGRGIGDDRSEISTTVGRDTRVRRWLADQNGHNPTDTTPSGKTLTVLWAACRKYSTLRGVPVQEGRPGGRTLPFRHMATPNENQPELFDGASAAPTTGLRRAKCGSPD